MTNHEFDKVSVGGNQQAKVLAAIGKLSPDFHELNMDLKDVLEYSQNPAFTAALMFKLAKEREKTNELLAKINEKFDSVMFELKTHNNRQSAAPINDAGVSEANSRRFEVLPEQDQLILNLTEEKGSIDAKTVKESLGYKGSNAACQRLNKLFKDGHLKKIQSGKKVLYLIAQNR